MAASAAAAAGAAEVRPTIMSRRAGRGKWTCTECGGGVEVSWQKCDACGADLTADGECVPNFTVVVGVGVGVGVVAVVVVLYVCE